MDKNLDTRDLYLRQSELEDFRDALNEARENLEEERAEEEPDQDNLIDLEKELETAEFMFGDAEKEELEALEALENEVTAYVPSESYIRGVELIHERNLTEYVKETFYESYDGLREADESSFTLVIDWDATADNMRLELAEVEYAGKTYLVRIE